MYSISQKVKNVVRGIVQGHGTPTHKKRQWDSEFSSGRWQCLENMAGDCIYPFVEKYAKGGSILDMGCGPGATANELKYEAYSRYTGMDVSEVALEKARKRSEQNKRVNNEFVQGDFCSYVPKQKYDVIMFADSLYYIPKPKLKSTLIRYSGFLSPSGAFVMKMKGPYPYIRRMIETEFPVIEKHLVNGSEIVVMVFQPPSAEK